MDRLSASHRGDEEIDLLTSADERVAGVVGVQHHEAGRANRVWMWDYDNEEEEEEEEMMMMKNPLRGKRTFILAGWASLAAYNLPVYLFNNVACKI